MAEQKPRSVREDLAALRIERGDGSARRRPAWLAPVALAAIVALFLLASWGAYRLTFGATPRVEVAYATRSVGGGATAKVLSGSGYVVTGDRYITLGVRVPGRVAAYLVEEGESVAQDQPLVQLDDRHYAASLREARASHRVAVANLELRRKELRRLEELHTRDFASEADLDVKQNELRVSEAEMERLSARISQLELDMEDTVVRAPASGVILEKLKEEGEMATPGGFAGSGEVVRMANLDEMRAEVDVSETDLSRVRLGQPAEVIPDAYPDRTYAARVVKLYPQINRQKGTLRLEVRIQQPDEWLRPDMSVRINFLRELADATEADPLVLADARAIRTLDGASFVWVVTEGRLRRQTIDTAGEQRGTQVVVSRGLSGGEALVIGEVAGLSEGRAVKITPSM